MDQSDFNLIFEKNQSDWDRFDPLEKLKKKSFLQMDQSLFLGIFRRIKNLKNYTIAFQYTTQI